MARYGLAPPSSNLHPLALIEGHHLKALAVARPRRGGRSWELCHLYFSDPEQQALFGSLLDQCGAYVAERGAERLFFRVAEEGPLQDTARRYGFFPGFVQEVYQREGPAADVAVPHLSFRPAYESDQYRLFRLYNASVPTMVRSTFGLTMNQWMDSQEGPAGKTEDYVWERHDELRCWLRVTQTQNGLRMEAMLHPEEGVSAFLVCEAALRLTGDPRPAWIVPGYQPALASALQRTGWRSTHRYVVLVKPLAKGVEELSASLVHA